AFWITILAPMALLLSGVGLLEKYPKKVSLPVMSAMFVLYSIAGFVWARRLFLRAQDVAWTGGMISLPKLRGFSKRPFSARLEGTRRPFLALVSKELQLQQAASLMAAGLL